MVLVGAGWTVAVSVGDGLGLGVGAVSVHAVSVSMSPTATTLIWEVLDFRVIFREFRRLNDDGLVIFATPISDSPLIL
jgi:hypothetical protein